MDQQCQLDPGQQSNRQFLIYLTGSFAGLGNQTVTINTLTDSPGTNPSIRRSPILTFIDFTSDPTFPHLLANFIPLGSAPTTDCSTNPGLAVANNVYP